MIAKLKDKERRFIHAAKVFVVFSLALYKTPVRCGAPKKV